MYGGTYYASSQKKSSTLRKKFTEFCLSVQNEAEWSFRPITVALAIQLPFRSKITYNNNILKKTVILAITTKSLI